MISLLPYLIKLKSPPSVGTRGDSRGTTQVFAVIKNPCNDAQGYQLHSFQVRPPMRRIPLLCNGSSRIGLMARAFARSTRRAIRLLRFCLAFRTSARVSGTRFLVYSVSSAVYAYCLAVFYNAGASVFKGV